jgi:hypothetical protein
MIFFSSRYKQVPSRRIKNPPVMPEKDFAENQAGENHYRHEIMEQGES